MNFNQINLLANALLESNIQFYNAKGFSPLSFNDKKTENTGYSKSIFFIKDKNLINIIKRSRLIHI